MNCGLSISTASSEKSQDILISPVSIGSAALFSVKPKLEKSPLRRKGGYRLEGHRGAGLLEPENSLKAFQRAIDLGLDGVELDVWLSKDGIPIVVHGTDEGLVTFKSLTSNNPEIVDQQNSTFTAFAFDLESKDLKAWQLPDGEYIPTLEEVLLLCKGKINVNIELKEENERVTKPTLEIVCKLNMLNQVCFSSFVHKQKEYVEKARKELDIQQQIEFGFLCWVLPDFDKYLDMADSGDTLNIDINLLVKNEEFILDQMAKATAKNMRIKYYFGFDIEETNYYQRLEDLKVNTLIINHPFKGIDYLTQEIF